MKKLIYPLFLFFLSDCSAQKKTETFSNGKFKAEFETENGRLNGKYNSSYLNGTKRAEGTFTNNTRSGTWTVYDSIGRKIQQREYKNHLEFIKLIPEKEKEGAAELFAGPIYSPAKNKQGFIEYFPVKERMVVLSSRIWRNLDKEKNKLFFEKDILYKTIFTFITDSTNESYCSPDENFVTRLKTEEIKKYSLKEYAVISWKIKEDFFYDIDRHVSETRIIGICPVGISKSSGDTSDLYWIYFPMIRAPMAKIITKEKNAAGEKMTLDDLFFFRNFTGEIYKESNVSDRKISDYVFTEEKKKEERKRIEINMIEKEHEIWLGRLPD